MTAKISSYSLNMSLSPFPKPEAKRGCLLTNTPLTIRPQMFQQHNLLPRLPITLPLHTTLAITQPTRDNDCRCPSSLLVLGREARIMSTSWGEVTAFLALMNRTNRFLDLDQAVAPNLGGFSLLLTAIRGRAKMILEWGRQSSRHGLATIRSKFRCFKSAFHRS